MKRVKMEIEGMTCSNCEKHVEKELARLGAKKIKVNPIDKSAIFSVEEKVSEDVLKRVVKTVGYEPGKVFVKVEENKRFFGRLLK